MVYKAGNKFRARLLRRIAWVLIIAVICFFIGLGAAFVKVQQGLKPVNSSQRTQDFTVKPGSSVSQIGEDLEKQDLIRSAWAFEIYVHGHNLASKLQAGSYAFSPNEGTRQIISTLTKGQVSARLVTILPGRRIDQVRADLINDGFSPDEVDRALQPQNYPNAAALSYLPAGQTSLEGLLWPNSFQKDAATTAEDIISQSLKETGDHLTPDVLSAFNANGLTPYQGIILASIVEQEVSKPQDQVQVAQVFLSRLKSGMSLGADSTARYGAIQANQPASLTFDSPYNTLKHTGLTPTPISSLSESALTAAAHPAGTNWLYFVSGDDGNTYFSTNLKDHQALTAQHCHKLCGQ